MARYDYHCEKCSITVEITKSIKDFAQVEGCPKCKAEMTRLPPTDTNFVLKGTGWYKTDYPK